MTAHSEFCEGEEGTLPHLNEVESCMCLCARCTAEDMCICPDCSGIACTCWEFK